MNMHRAALANGDPRLRHHRRQQLLQDKGLDQSTYLAHPSHSPDQPASASSLRRHIMAALIHQRQPIDRMNHALQPVSPASYGSSMEISPYDPAVNPTCSADFKGRMDEPNDSLKTSTQLLKVLNRIWSLEEQHASSIQLIKALKLELDHGRMKIKDLLRDRQADRREMDDLMKQITEDKLIRKSKEQDRLRAAVQSVRDELEDERKLRRRSESLHRKLARELSEVKASLSVALQEIERETSARKLLEGLCDEFAEGIKEYEQEVHGLKHKCEKDWAERTDHDRSILHISESWLDQRMQMQLEETDTGFAGKRSMVGKLSVEVETFLQAKQRTSSTNNLGERKHRKSLKSVPLDETVSAPQKLDDENDYIGNDSNCFELYKTVEGSCALHEAEIRENKIYETLKTDPIEKKTLTRQRNTSCSTQSLQVKFEEELDGAVPNIEDKKFDDVNLEEGKSSERKPVEIRASVKSEHKPPEDGEDEKKNKNDEFHGSYQNHLTDSLIKNQLVVSNAVKTPTDNTNGDASCSDSGRQNLKSTIASGDLDISEASKPVSRGNTLKAKVEVSTKGRRSWLKSLKGPF